MNLPPAALPVRRARLGVSALFLVNGAFIATVLPRLPLIKAGLGLSNAELGAAVAAMPIGGLLAGGLAGILIHRFGSGRLTVVTGVAYGLVLVAIGLAPSWIALAGAFLLIGALDATMDAAQNAHGIVVQRRYGRSILHAFHGWWSAGTLVGGGAGALAAAAGIPVSIHLGVAGLALAGITLAASRALLPGRDVDVHEEDIEPVRLRDVRRILQLLGPLALIGLLGVMLEDAASTWSSVYLVDVLGSPAGIAAMAYVGYAAAMTAGRLTNDRWVDRWGPVRVARAGGLLAAGGLALVVAAGVAGIGLLAFLGFAAVGFGASPLFPIMVDRAASGTGIPPAHGVAIVSWLARAGFVIAPALVGVAADAAGLATAFLIPLTVGLLIAAFAPTLLRMATGNRPGPPAAVA